jgi:hypothetical protein
MTFIFSYCLKFRTVLHATVWVCSSCCFCLKHVSGLIKFCTQTSDAPCAWSAAWCLRRDGHSSIASGTNQIVRHALSQVVSDMTANWSTKLTYSMASHMPIDLSQVQSSLVGHTSFSIWSFSPITLRALKCSVLLRSTLFKSCSHSQYHGMSMRVGLDVVLY